MSWKNLVLQSWPKILSIPIRLQYSLIINISGRNQVTTQIFCMEIIIKERQHLRLPPLDGYGELYLSSNQIRGFFDHQYLLKESINISGFLYGYKHPRRQHLNYHFWLCVASCVFCPVRLQDVFIINIWRKSSNLLDFWYGVSHQTKVACLTTSLGWVCQLCPLPNEIAGFFDHQYLWKESSDIQHGVCHQGKTAPETTTFGWMQLVVPLVQNCKGKVACKTT